MSKQNNLTDFLTDVANAIRAKKGSTDLINPQNFSAEIDALSGGLEVVDMTETTATIEPNKVYVWGMVESLNITLGASTDENDFFAFRFRCSKPTMTVVTVNGATWAEDTELDETGKPVLDLGSWYQCEIKGGTSVLYARLAHYIPFADSNVEAVLLAKGVGDGLGVTYKDAEKVTSISNWFSYNADITAFAEFVNFSGIRVLSNYAFYECSALTEITLPASLTDIDRFTFYRCPFSQIILPSALTSIGEYAFQGCSSLTRAANFENTKVTSIGNGIFRYCSSLMEIILPAGVTSIGEYAFQGASFEEINIPASLTSISSSFYDCKKLKRVINLENTQLTSIGGNAFYECSALTEITLPSALTSIGNGAFFRCSSLAEITLPSALTSIGEYAFQGCSSLTKAEGLANTKLTMISAKLFASCIKLTEITLPSTLTSIGAYAFDDCPSLKTMTVNANTPPTLASGAIPTSIGAIYVPDESVAAYQAATNWSRFASKIKGISEMPAE